MRDSSLSMLVFAGYLGVLGAFCTLYSRPFLWFGFHNVSGPWVRTLGYILLALAFFYFSAVREQATNFFRWTVYARLPLLPFFVVLVISHIAPPIMLLIGLWDTACAFWTRSALRYEAAH